MIRNVVIGILAVALLGSLYALKSNEDENELYRHAAERLHKQAVQRLENDLRETTQQRDVLADSISDLNIRYEALVRIDSIKTLEIKKIKNAFKNKTSAQLQAEMIRVANEAQ